jgi:hypothetical protein
METIKLTKPIYEYSANEWLRIWSEARRAEMRRLYAGGNLSLAKVGERFGVTRQNVARVLKG